MRTSALAAASLLAICGTAAAADLPEAPPVLAAPAGWSGFYVGVNAGGGLGNGNSNFSIGGVTFATVNNYLSGAIGGAQAGFNWQGGPALFGIETDIQASSVKGTITAPCLALCGLPLTANYSQKMPWFGTVRGRLGLVGGGWLIYATAGYAYARLETDASASAGPASASISLRETRGGWTAGGGIEVELAPGWTTKLEYLYFDYGRHTNTLLLGGAVPSIADNARLTMNVVRAGLNYWF
jgi:opacity protein-like surface antigen